jgi:hypothetical protein
MVGLIFSLWPASTVLAGGGMVLREDQCIVQIGFYEAHFTAYQPETNGNEEFCQTLPDTGVTLFALDYLHDSLKLVPVDFRIIHNTTNLGRFVQLSDVQALGDLSELTVYFKAGSIRADASLRIEHNFREAGEYIGVVSAGHPSKATIYTAAFPFTVGVTNYAAWGRTLFGGLILVLAAVVVLRKRPGPKLSEK